MVFYYRELLAIFILLCQYCLCRNAILDIQKFQAKLKKLFDIYKLRYVKGFMSKLLMQNATLSTRESFRFSVQKKPFGFFCIQKSSNKTKRTFLFYRKGGFNKVKKAFDLIFWAYSLKD